MESNSSSFGIPKKASSSVWKHFKLKNTNGKLEYENAFCNICDNKISYYRSTTNLLGHLRSNHLKEFYLILKKFINLFVNIFFRPFV